METDSERDGDERRQRNRKRGGGETGHQDKLKGNQVQRILVTDSHTRFKWSADWRMVAIYQRIEILDFYGMYSYVFYYDECWQCILIQNRRPCVFACPIVIICQIGDSIL